MIGDVVNSWLTDRGFKVDCGHLDRNWPGMSYCFAYCGRCRMLVYDNYVRFWLSHCKIHFSDPDLFKKLDFYMRKKL